MVTLSRSGDSAARGALSRVRGFFREIRLTWTLLSPEQRVAGFAAVLLIVSTFGPFSFVEAAIVLVAVSVLVLLRMRSLGRQFHLPFGDGTVIAAAALWCALLIVVRVLDRPLGQNLLALGCALLLFLAGARERAKRPPDDSPTERNLERSRGRQRRSRPSRPDWPTTPLADPVTRPLPEDPPEMRVPGEREAQDDQDSAETAPESSPSTRAAGPAPGDAR